MTEQAEDFSSDILGSMHFLPVEFVSLLIRTYSLQNICIGQIKFVLQTNLLQSMVGKVTTKMSNC